MKSSPLGYLDAAGLRAQHILPLTWFTLCVSIAVCVAIALLLWVAVRRKRVPHDVDIASVSIERGGDGLRWIRIGLLLSAVPLAVTLIWTMLALAAIAGPPANPALVLDVTARQWWWDVHYSGAQPVDAFETANEIHIPVGKPVLLRLHAADVIHSFWVPKLTGKTDVIPGQINQSWLQTDTPGRYLGQCSEFCGYQHAHMQFEVVAQSPAEFAAWQAAQRQPAAMPATPEAARGLRVVQFRCTSCHAIRGASAGAASGPDLTHLMSRRALAAGTLANTPENLEAVIQHPQYAKPEALMPNQFLSAQQLRDVLAYMGTLR
ncbi:MAG TPA: cytochrome c oxidase subunit II [Xanthobacteraceae bacterium]|jgi:cytochrome c oxidase subunit 2